MINKDANGKNIRDNSEIGPENRIYSLQKT